MGRFKNPEDRMDFAFRFRMTESDLDNLVKASNELDISKAKLIREALNLYYDITGVLK